MGWDIQINPTAEALHIRRDLFQLLEKYMTDFEMRYVWVPPGKRVINALKAYQPDGDDEHRAVTELIERFENRETVELMFGY